MKIILTSNNKNKLREFREILEPAGFEVISQSEAGVDIEAEENGETFEENARIKARAVYDRLKMPVIADDSGLEVDMLGGEPGVRSARYAEVGHRRERVLRELEGVPWDKRTARFVCVICYIDEEGNEHFARGECEGKIGYENRGENGFGYDPIFMYNGKSFAELSAEEKNRISHRARALEMFKDILT
ncbi:MAG: RdgB/HAM1 family non-canonical purine NTP pyrophosphatase [Ruminococcus sp.]|nr:RdgB/HAM1 family non-canonical purine NTP pyrophosphatase [Ruminococcus sp.]